MKHLFNAKDYRVPICLEPWPIYYHYNTCTYVYMCTFDRATSSILSPVVVMETEKKIKYL